MKKISDLFYVNPAILPVKKFDGTVTVKVFYKKYSLM